MVVAVAVGVVVVVVVGVGVAVVKINELDISDAFFIDITSVLSIFVSCRYLYAGSYHFAA